MASRQGAGDKGDRPRAGGAKGAVSVLRIALCLAVLATAAFGDPERERAIALAIEQLGDGSFVVREAASAALWEHGLAAELALRRASASKDLERANRARQLLDRFRRGDYPGVTAGERTLLEYLPHAGRFERAARVQDLIASPLATPDAVMFVLRDESADVLRSLGSQVGRDLAQRLIATSRPDDAVEALEILARDGNDVACRRLAALHLTRGSLPARVGRTGDAPRLACWLFHFAGDGRRAIAAAEATNDAWLRDLIQRANGDWDSLYARARTSPVDASDVSANGVLAALARVTGNSAECLLPTSRVATSSTSSENRARVLLALDQPAPTLEYLAQRGWEEDLLQARIDRIEIDEALEVAEELELWGSSLAVARTARARLLGRLGRRAEAREVVSAVIEAEVQKFRESRPGEDTPPDDSAEASGRTDLCEALAVLAGLGDGELARRTISPLLKDATASERAALVGSAWIDGEVAETWWRALVDDRTPAEVLGDVEKAMNGRPVGDRMHECIPRASASGYEVARWVLCLQRVRRGDEALDLLIPAIDRGEAHAEMAMEVAWLAASLGRWDAAERAATEAIRRIPTSAHATAMASIAARNLGRVNDGRRLADHADMLALDDDRARSAMAWWYATWRCPDDAARQVARIVRMSAPSTYTLSYSLVARGYADRGHVGVGDPVAVAATLAEVDRLDELSCRWSWSTLEQLARGAPRNVALAARAIELGRTKDALWHLDRALEFAPHDVRAHGLRLYAHPDRGEAVSRAFAEHGWIVSLLERFPDSAWLHDHHARLAAATGIRLEQGLRSADRAVALDPAECAYLVSLAAVLRRMGEHERARALLDRVIALPPSDEDYSAVVTYEWRDPVEGVRDR